MSPAIHVEGLGKRYHIGQRPRYLALRDRLAAALRAPARVWKSRFNGATPRNEIWALRDIDFEVKQGEVVGVIGRNGAGKTTLLKLLSRVTEPSTGWAEISGSVGSLLEVGTGFHPELTGRENIYLNGAILGMGRREIARKFDDIVGFSEVVEFLDTPLKHYSTGMQMRLAFAVAAHFEPQILLVDEVLAVGDLAFQKKCLGKMDEVARGGRTIIFVSHQMNQIRRLCNRAIWIDRGRVREDGPVAQVVSSYETAMARGGNVEQEHRDLEDKTRFVKWQIAGLPEGTAHQLDSLGEVTIHFDLQLNQALQRGHHGIALFSGGRELIWGRAIDNLRLEPGLHRISYTFPCLPLRPGPYFWQVSLWENGNCFDAWDCLPQMIVATPNFQHPRDEWSGILNIPSQVRVSQLDGVECTNRAKAHGAS
ncbi:MAG TPA: polysaccharide ABC transporter ATP-binding protein [Candidatus Acidoferrales bacterium]|nr:polysaccharide ABC transporter ATP-binding protein [Candidatus Acidoferrales bacterium]